MTKLTKDEKSQDRRDLRRLRRENTRLKREIEKLRKEKEAIEKKKEAVEKEYEEYKARHPENVGVKSGKPYVIKPANRSTERKRPGARPGHEPHFRKKPSHIDHVVEVPVSECPHCHSRELSDVQEVRERTVEDIPVVRPVVTQYHIERRYCKHCRSLVENHVTTALPRARLGLRTMLMTVYLKIGQRLPVEVVTRVLKASFGIDVSEGEIIHILDQMAEAFGPLYEQLVQDLRDAPARGIDETSWRIDGENVWLWAFITRGEALYVIDKSRGHEVPLEVLGTEPKGVDIHDRFSAYNTLARKTGNRPQQVCWAHLIQDGKELAQFHGEEGEVILRILRKTYYRAMAFDHKGTEKDVEALFHHMKGDLDRQYRSVKCRKFVAGLLRVKDWLFVFVINPDVDATNNAAERGLRHSVVARKISGGSRSPKGARTYQVLTSIHHTLIKRGKDLLTDGPSILNTSHG